MKTFNFNAGPAALPEEVLHQLSESVINLDGSGLSILEIPHRASQFTDLLNEASFLVKELARLDDDFEVLWLPGGGRLQFCMLPINFLKDGKKAGYIHSGHWAEAAEKSAKFYGETEIISSSATEHFKALPLLENQYPGYVYLHLTSNNTIEGTQWKTLPANLGSPLIVDMSSDIFGQHRDYKTCDLFYAVAQKNLGAAGVTMVAIRKDFLAKHKTDVPPMLSYAHQVKNNSMLNTPPVFSIYTCLLMLRWLKKNGLQNVINTNAEKARKVYEAIEASPYFNCPVAPADRSVMNVVFTGKNESIEKEFLKFAEQNNVLNIAGHRSVGAFRISLYNGVSEAAVEHLVSVMNQFTPSATY